MPKKPNLSTHAVIAISITVLMPNRLRKNGISNMQRASLTCDTETSIVALLAAKLLAISATGLLLKLVRKGPAKPLVTCSDIPNSIEKMKNRAILRCLKSLNALSPSCS